uniref:Uncharacterized protein n=1 Tax=Neogobius melanostomus TaxID=47308 RepID=A0A8C6TKU8_9GOBI
MASSLEEELHCQICLDVFKNPVILPCSHSFCYDCLSSWWTSKAIRECPVCKEKHFNADITALPSNLVLRKLCEAFVQQRAKDAATPVCSLHSEKLKLFCLDHQEPVCLVCQASKAHSHHTFKPIDEAAQDYREELKEAIAQLKKKEKQCALFHAKWDCLDKHIEIQASQTEAQVKERFAKLHEFLRNEEKDRLGALREEKALKKSKISKVIRFISKEMQSLKETIKATEKELVAGDVLFLTKCKAVVERVDSYPTWEEPHIGAGALIDEAKHLSNLDFNVWMKMKDTVIYSPVILDPNTAGSRLVLSDNLTAVSIGKSTQELPENPERLSYYCVLGSEGFTHGSHTWEAEVKNNQNWTLGVATVSGQQGVASLAQIWRLCYCEGTYSAETKTGHFTFLSLKKQPQKIQVNLYIEQGKLSFCDAETQTHLCTFTDTFTGNKLYPYMFTEDGTPLKIVQRKVYVTIK